MKQCGKVSCKVAELVKKTKKGMKLSYSGWRRKLDSWSRRKRTYGRRVLSGTSMHSSTDIVSDKSCALPSHPDAMTTPSICTLGKVICLPNIHLVGDFMSSIYTLGNVMCLYVLLKHFWQCCVSSTYTVGDLICLPIIHCWCCDVSSINTSGDVACLPHTLLVMLLQVSLSKEYSPQVWSTFSKMDVHSLNNILHGLGQVVEHLSKVQ